MRILYTRAAALVACLMLCPCGRVRAAAAPDAKPPVFMLSGQEAAVTAAAFSPDGKILATTGDGLSIRLWDPATAEEVGALSPSEKPAAGVTLNRIIFSPDGSLLATCGSTSNVTVYDVAARKVKYDINTAGRPTVLAISPDNTTLATNGIEATTAVVKFFDLATGAKRTSAKFKDNVNSIAYSHDGKMLACGRGTNGGGGNNIIIVDPATGNEISSILDEGAFIQAIAFSPDDKTLATAGRWVKLWVVASKQEKTKPHAPNEISGQGTSQWLAFTTGGKYLVDTISGFGFVDVATATFTRTYAFDNVNAANPLAISPDGSLAVAGVGRFAKLWKLAPLASGAPATSTATLQVTGGTPTTPLGPKHDGATLIIEGHEKNIQSLAFSPDGATIYSAAPDFSLRAWDTTTGKERFSSPLFASTGTELFTYDSGKKLLFGQKLFDAGTGKEIGTLETNSGGDINKVYVAANANVAVAPSFNSLVALWDIPKARTTVKFSGQRPQQIALASDGKTVYTWGSSTPSINIFDTTNGSAKGTIAAPNVRTFTLAADGKLLALVGGQSLRLVDAQTQQDVAAIKYTALPNKILFTPDSKMLVIGAGFYEVPSLKLITNVKHGSDVQAISPDGKLLAVAEQDRIRIMTLADALAGK